MYGCYSLKIVLTHYCKLILLYNVRIIVHTFLLRSDVDPKVK